VGKGNEVHGIKCRTALFNTDRLYQDPHETNRGFFLRHGGRLRFHCECLGDRVDSLLAAHRDDGLGPLLKIGIGQDVTMRELAEKVKKVVRYSGEVVLDGSQSDGTQKLLDILRL